MNIKFNCIHAVDYISKNEEGKLTRWQKVVLWQHLAYCVLCRRFFSQSKIIGRAAAERFKQEEFSLTLEQKENILNAVVNEN